MKRLRWAGLFAALVTFGLTISERAPAQEDFYKGKTLTFIVGSGPSGGYDTYGRLFAPFFADHIPGKPKVVVQNMVGASSLRAASFMANVATRDGTVVAITLSSIPTAPQLTPTGANFDPTQFGWLGSMTRDPFVGFVWHTSPIKTLQDIFDREVTMGADSLGSAGADLAVIAKTFFGLKLKLVLGYPDSNSVKLAMEKGEVEGTFANFFADLKSTRADWLKKGLVRIVVQHGFTRSPDLPDVPLLYDLARTDEQKSALRLLLARQEFAKPVFAPPGVAPERLAILRKAFEDTLKDPEFLAAAAKLGVPIDGPLNGEELSRMVIEIGKTPPEIGSRVRSIFENYK